MKDERIAQAAAEQTAIISLKNTIYGSVHYRLFEIDEDNCNFVARFIRVEPVCSDYSVRDYNVPGTLESRNSEIEVIQSYVENKDVKIIFTWHDIINMRFNEDISYEEFIDQAIEELLVAAREYPHVILSTDKEVENCWQFVNKLYEKFNNITGEIYSWDGSCHLYIEDLPVEFHVDDVVYVSGAKLEIDEYSLDKIIKG